MAEKWKKTAHIVKREWLEKDIMDFWIAEEEIAGVSRAGQFLSLYCKDGSRLLPRPISICDIDSEKGLLRLVFRIAGKGTEEISHYFVGDTIEVLGPLGNGFTTKPGVSLLMGGGIGIPPMLALAKELQRDWGKDANIIVVLGYRDTVFLADDFPEGVTVYVATEDGSAGTRGNVLDAVREQKINADQVYACGPLPMLRGIQQFARETGIPAQISMEEKMACGIGACLACVCKTKGIDDHSKVANQRVCMEGPVFDANQVVL